MHRRDWSFFCSLFLTRLADQVLLFLVPLLVFRLTGSAGWAGMAFFVETLPRYLAFPLCGALCDRVPPVRLLHVSQRWRALACAAAVGGYAWQGGVGWLVALSAVCGVLTTQGLMAREVLLPQVFRGERFERVLSFTQMADQAGTVLGPLLAAALLQLWPWQGVALAAAGGFVLADAIVSGWLRALAPLIAAPQGRGERWRTTFATAWQQLRTLPGLWQSTALAAAVNLVVGVTLATSALMMTGVHGQSTGGYAALQLAGALMTLLVLFIVAHAGLNLRTLGRASFLMVAGGGLMSGVAESVGLYVLGFVVVVGFDKMFSVFVRSLRQRLIPARDFGKTSGVAVLFNNLSQPLAGLCVAMFAPDVGAPWVIVALSLLAAGVGAGVGFAWMREEGKRAGEVSRP